MYIRKFKNVYKRLPPINGTLCRDYCKSLGLACVIGSVSGFFLKTHNAHQLASLGMLLAFGVITSYLGITGNNKDD